MISNDCMLSLHPCYKGHTCMNYLPFQSHNQIDGWALQSIIMGYVSIYL